MKTFRINLDAMLVLVSVFAVSFGFNLYQRLQYSDLMQAYVDAETKAQDMEINWKFVKSEFEACKQRQTTP